MGEALLEQKWVHIQGQVDFPGGSDGSVCLQCERPGFDPWVEKIPWRRKWQPTPVPCLEIPMDGGAWCRLLSMGSQRVGHD